MIRNFAFPEYAELAECRKVVDDCLAGQKTIKSKEEYLPPNAWQKVHTEQYYEFLRRALFPGETKYSQTIYAGLFSLGSPRVTLPEDGRMNFIQRKAGVYGDTLKDLQMRLNNGQMTHGLRCMLLETSSNQKYPFFVNEYVASKFLRAHFISVEGESRADFILLDESTYEYDLKTLKDIPHYKLRILALDDNLEYYQRVVKPEDFKEGLDIKNPPAPEKDSSVVYPTYQDQRFNKIPFVWCGASGISGASFDYPPMLELAQTELKLYMAMAHNSQHIYMNTQEVLVFTGVNDSKKIENVAVGAGAAITIKNDKAKAQYVSTNGVGFTAEEDEIKRLKADIEQKRLSLMSAKSHQSGTVVGLVQNSQSAPLRTVVNTSGTAITAIMRYMAEWMGYDDDAASLVSYVPSQEFANPRVNLSEFIALCKSVYEGEVKMLEEDLYNMARESGYINNSLTWEQFKAKYELEAEERTRRASILPESKGNPFQPVPVRVSP
jgi:hypothetical protein